MSLEPLRSEFADDPDMHELLVEFAAGLKETCQKLRSSMESGDLEGVRRLGHQLKGAGGGYGYPGITDAGAELERRVRQFETINADVRQAADALIELCDRARAVFSAE